MLKEFFSNIGMMVLRTEEINPQIKGNTCEYCRFSSRNNPEWSEMRKSYPCNRKHNFCHNEKCKLPDFVDGEVFVDECAHEFVCRGKFFKPGQGILK